jgi:aryl-alcohol dehydrogenase-like predicted oxidoreductase
LTQRRFRPILTGTPMETRRLGSTDMVASILGFGGSEIGYQNTAARTVARLLGSALDAGLNVIDTAECYDESEVLIGRALGPRRRECYLFTKCGHAGGWGRAEWRPAPLLASVERSLRRLATDHLDLIQLHSCSLAELRKGDAIAALEQARERGFARYIGYSGDGEAARYAVECGRFDTLQTSVSIADQEAIELTLPLARAKKLGVIAKRPLANVAWQHAKKPQSLLPAVLDAPAGSTISCAGRPTAVATALRFTLAAPGVHAIVGTTDPSGGPGTPLCSRTASPRRVQANPRALAEVARPRGPARCDAVYPPARGFRRRAAS